MLPVQQVLEVERVTNLVSGFGWVKVSEVIEGEDIIITIKKTIESPASTESQE